MPERFKHLYHLSQEEIEDIWTNGFFVFDTNIFLHLYRYPLQDREKLLNILLSPKILERTFIPHQVALEFHKDRLVVIDQQKTIKDKVISLINTQINGLEDKFKQIGISHSHPFIDTDSIISNIRSFFEDITIKLEDDFRQYPANYFDDPILEQVHKIMKGRIGQEFPETETDKLKQEADERFMKKIPPGYLDKDKEENKHGDFFIWMQIINFSKTHKVHIVFVTDDKKEDWWLKKSFNIWAATGLREEFEKETKMQFCITKLNNFIEKANKVSSKPLKAEEVKKLANLSQKISGSLNILKEIEIAHNISKLCTPSILSIIDKNIINKITDIYHNSIIEENISNDHSNFSQNYYLKKEIKAEKIANWFLENYERPTSAVPFDNEEYICDKGRSYLDRKVLKEEFPEATQLEVSFALKKIRKHGGPYWIKRTQYSEPDK